MIKTDYRQKLLQQLKTMPSDKKAVADQILMAKLIASPAFQNAQIIATYLPLPHEVATASLIQAAHHQGKTVLVPRTLPQGQLIFLPYDPDQLERGPYGIWQPTNQAPLIPKTAIDLIHVPGLAFSPQGHRLGYGGGYYDRYLADFTGHTIATAYHCQLKPLTPEPHDIPVKELLIDDLSETVF